MSNRQALINFIQAWLNSCPTLVPFKGLFEGLIDQFVQDLSTEFEFIKYDTFQTQERLLERLFDKIHLIESRLNELDRGINQ